MKHYVIYVPGLGDYFDGGRWFAGCLWRIFGVKTKFVPMRWDSKEKYEHKVQRLTRVIETAQNAGYTVSLIGESAGASIVLNVAAAIPDIYRIVTIAGVNSSDLPIWPVTKKRSPSFVVAAGKINESLRRIDTSKIHTLHALFDHIVTPRYNDIKGAHNHTLPTIGHMPTVILCLTLFSPYVIRLIKRP